MRMWAGRSGLGVAGEDRHDLAGARVPVELRLLEDRRAVAQDLEPSPAGWDQFYLCRREVVAYLGRQTGGPWFVVSKSAVFDADFHAVPPLRGS
jgi:hypothetical protein